MSNLPFEGVRIADFTWWAAGPYATRVFAAFGAEVIKVESTVHRDQIREVPRTRPGTSGINAGLAFNTTHAGKMGITLNPKHPKGHDVAKRLVSKSDIVADNMTWGAMERLGLGYDELVKIKPDIIALSMPSMSPGGPYTHFTANGDQLAAMAGLYHLTGYVDKPGMAPGQVWPDFTSNPYHATTALIAALYYRNKTGKGQQIILSQYECTTSVTGLAIMDYSVNGNVQSRMDNRSPYGAPHGIYKCQGDDRWCAIAALSDQEWKGLTKSMGNPEWSQDGKFSTVLGRVENVDELDWFIEQWTSTRQAEEIMNTLQAAGVPAGVVQNGRDLMENDPQLKERQHYVYLDHAEIGSMAFDNVPFKLSQTPGKLTSAAPQLGEHNDYVLSEILGYSEEEINELILENVLE